MKWSLFFSFIFLSCAVVKPLQAQQSVQPIELTMPVDCELGWNCWLVNYVDHDRTKGSKDYACGNQSYDTHKGTDFMIRSFRELQGGVIVRAAANGVVMGTRDGMKDKDFRRIPAEQLKGKECGNGIRINHGQGWYTQYCHLRKNSVRVKKAQKVQKGDIIGFVGNSGRAQFPHLHFQVEYIKPGSGKRRGAIVDPFVGLGRNDSCARGPKPLWSPAALQQMDYKRLDIIDAGFAARPPKGEGLMQGLYDDEVLSVRSPNLLLWGRILHVKKGDELTFRIEGPDGSEILNYNSTIDKDRAYATPHSGLRKRSLQWPSGVYQGFIELKRRTEKGVQTFHREATITLR